MWINQNFAVNTVADFSAWVAGGIQNSPVAVPAGSTVPGTPCITTGTVNAVHFLPTTAAPEGTFRAGTTLLDFVKDVDKSRNDRFIATGHSLGGAFSPSLALALVSSGVIPGDSTLTYPSAGPSPGNAGSTELFVKIPSHRQSDTAKNYQGWNLNPVNTLDILPQAWCPFKSVSQKQNLGNIPTIYGEPALDIIVGITVVFTLHALSSGAVSFPSRASISLAPLLPLRRRTWKSAVRGLSRKQRGRYCSMTLSLLGSSGRVSIQKRLRRKLRRPRALKKGRLSSAVHKQV